MKKFGSTDKSSRRAAVIRIVVLQLLVVVHGAGRFSKDLDPLMYPDVLYI